MILENTIKQGSKILKAHNIGTPELDAEIILSNIMGVTREFLILNNNIKIESKILEKYNHAIQRRIKNEPVAYIINKKEFWSTNFLINNATLIPRPETELIVFEVIKFFKKKKISVLDIGTGCGCILLSILKELKFSKGVGIDISRQAIKIAKINAKKLSLVNKATFKTSKIENFNQGKYDLIVSNPPYISVGQLKYLSKEITDYEPISALNGGIDGLDLIKKVIYKSKSLLNKSGILAIEIGNNQYKKVSKILEENGFKELNKVYDFNFNVRCIISTK